MKLLLVTSGFPLHGEVAAQFLPDLIRELNRRDCHVHILTQNTRSRQTERLTLWDGCDITCFGWGGGDTPLVQLFERRIGGAALALQYIHRAIAAGKCLAREWQPDLVFAEWLVPGGLIANRIARYAGRPYATRALGSDVNLAARNPFVRMVVRFVVRRAAALFADGFDLCRKTTELADGKECHFAATTRTLGEERTEFRPAPDAGTFTTCTVGRLHRVKGQDILVEAQGALAARGAAVRSYIVGSGEDQENLAEQARRLGVSEWVALTGRLGDGDITDLLAHVDCVVIPSRSESIPVSLSEAVRAGKPLIVTDVGDMKHLVETYGLGLVVPSEDPTALAEAIETMACTEDRSQYVRQRDEVLEVLSSAGAAEALMSEFRRALAVRNGS